MLLHLPPQLEYDHFAHPSLSAVILLGLREVIGGSPEHLDVATISDALRAPDRRALLIHDTVPGGTGYLAEFADPHRVWNVLTAARKIVRECPCRDEDRLACHRCLLPFARGPELDKVSRETALTVLNDILGLKNGARAKPDFDDWHITDDPPPPSPSSDESFLEKDFYAAFIARLKGMGAAIVETPGTYGSSAAITVQGAVVRRWTLKPQVALGNVQPDFVLSTQDSAIPEIAIFADGRRFHASAEHNNVAIDVGKRTGLRDAGYLVWAFSPDDLQRFKDNVTEAPSWLDTHGADFVKTQFGVAPASIALLSADPVTQLLDFLLHPDIDKWRLLSTHLPFLFLRSSKRCKSSAESVAEAALRLLLGGAPFPSKGIDMCWPFTQGTIAITAAVTPQGHKKPTATLALDDGDEPLEAFNGRDWKEWLRLSNWFGISGRHRITTRSLLEQVAGTAAPVVDNAEPLSPEWQTLLAATVSDAEGQLVRALAASPGMPVPELGYETDDGVVFDAAWPGVQVGVVIDGSVELTGWTVCGADVDQITTTLHQNGVL